MLLLWAMANPIFIDVLEFPDLLFEWNAWPNGMPTLTALNVKAREIHRFLQKKLPEIVELPHEKQIRLSEKLGRLQARLYSTQQTVFASHLAGMTFAEVIAATIDALESPSAPPVTFLKFAMARELAEHNFGKDRVFNADQAIELELGNCNRGSRKEIVKAAVQNSVKYAQESKEETLLDSFTSEESEARWTHAIEVYSNPENDLAQCIEMVESVRKRLAKPSSYYCVIL